MTSLEANLLCCLTLSDLQTSYLPEAYPCLDHMVAYTVADLN